MFAGLAVSMGYQIFATPGSTSIAWGRACVYHPILYRARWVPVLVFVRPTGFQSEYVPGPLGSSLGLCQAYWVPVSICTGPTGFQCQSVPGPFGSSLNLYVAYWVPVSVCMMPTGFQSQSV